MVLLHNCWHPDSISPFFVSHSFISSHVGEKWTSGPQMRLVIITMLSSWFTCTFWSFTWMIRKSFITFTPVRPIRVVAFCIFMANRGMFHTLIIICIAIHGNWDILQWKNIVLSLIKILVTFTFSICEYQPFFTTAHINCFMIRGISCTELGAVISNSILTLWCTCKSKIAAGIEFCVAWNISL